MFTANDLRRQVQPQVGYPVLELRILANDGSWAVYPATAASLLAPRASESGSSVLLGPIGGAVAVVVLGTHACTHARAHARMHTRAHARAPATGIIVVALLLIRRRRNKFLTQPSPDAMLVPPPELGESCTSIRVHPEPSVPEDAQVCAATAIS